jgi:hypothetical protein
VVTVAGAGWAGKKNGDFLRLADRGFDMLVTTDKGIPHQQNLSWFDLVVVLLRARSNALEDLAPLMAEVNSVLNSVEPGSAVRRLARERAPPWQDRPAHENARKAPKPCRIIAPARPVCRKP